MQKQTEGIHTQLKFRIQVWNQKCNGRVWVTQD